MGKPIARRCKAIRHGIRRARHDKRAMYEVGRILLDLRSTPVRTLDHAAAVVVAYIFPVLVGMVAPPIFTTAGWAWHREVSHPYAEPQLAEAPTVNPDWWKR